jgi:hypothetical protein
MGILRATGAGDGEADAATVVGGRQECKPGWHADGGGLYLQVTAGEKDGQINKSWVFRYARNKRERQMGLGSFNTIGLSQAREEAGRWQGILKEVRDPIEVRDAERAAQQQAARPAPDAPLSRHFRRA